MRAPVTAMGFRSGRLIGCEFNSSTLRHVQAVAQEWRRTGLHVDVTDLMPPPGGGHAYVLTASSPTTVMVLRCEVWRQRRLLRGARKVWTIQISVRQREAGPDEPSREIGAVAALDQQDLWEQIEAWIDGRLRPAPSIDVAVAELA